MLSFAQSNPKALSRAITVVENELEGYRDLLFSPKTGRNIPIIGFTGLPGAGKSSLINAIIGRLSLAGKKIGVIAIDPTSPFNHGSLLGDRIRMSEHFNDANVFIRSIATRGSLGGLSEKTIEVTEVMKAAWFDIIFVETVGVGQSEVEIAGLADTTVVVFVPEAGDEIQIMKSGIVEIADIIVVNKSDREGADALISNLTKAIHSAHWKDRTPPMLKTSATSGSGIEELIAEIEKYGLSDEAFRKKIFLYTEKSYRIIQKKRMKDVDKIQLQRAIEKEMVVPDFNLFQFADSYSVLQ